MDLLDCSPCRFCGWGKFTNQCLVEGSVECPDCYARGPIAETNDQAIKNWNNPTILRII